MCPSLASLDRIHTKTVRAGFRLDLAKLIFANRWVWGQWAEVSRNGGTALAAKLDFFCSNAGNRTFHVFIYAIALREMGYLLESDRLGRPGW